MSKAKAVAKKNNEKEAKPAADVCMVLPGNDLMAITNLLGVIVENVRLEFSPNGMKSVCVDASHVEMVCLNYGNFDESDVPKHTVTVELSKLHGILKRFLGKAKGRGEKRKSDYTLIFGLDKEKAQYSVSDVDGEWKAAYRWLDPSTVISPKVPDIEYRTSFEMPATKMAEKLEFCKLVTDLVTIEVNDQVVFKADRHDGSEKKDNQIARHKTTGGSSAVDNKKAGRAVEAQYSLTHLLPVVKALKGQNLKVSIGDAFPIKIECELDLGYETKPLKFTYYLAPRVESDY